MTSIRLETETDIEHLRKVALVQHVELQRLARQVVELKREVAELRGQPMTQQELAGLFDSELERLAKERETSPPPARPKRPRKVRTEFGPREQSGLEQATERHTLDPADLPCPECGHELAEMEGQFDESQVVDVFEVRYVLVTQQLQKYRCPKGCCIDQPLTPQRAVPGGRYSLAFAAKVAVDKYLNHLPLARQSRIMAQHKLSVSRNVLWKQLEHIGSALRPVWLSLIESILAEPVIGLDQTGWPNLEQLSQKKWQMWCLTAPDRVAHLIRDDKGRQTFDEVTFGFEGTIVCDMMSTHLSAEKRRPEIRLAACWAHIRRKFGDAESDFPNARVPIGYIRQLYDLERDITDREERRRVRDEQSRKVAQALHDWLLATSLPKTTRLGNAIRHALGHWKQLTTFLDDPDIPLDNNGTERALRGPVVGRRNHFGSKSREGTEIAAILYSLVETAKLVGVPVADYLIEAVTHSRAGYVLTPQAYQQRLACPNDD